MTPEQSRLTKAEIEWMAYDNKLNLNKDEIQKLYDE